ncbi:MAG: hypothetical protein RSE61_07065 [Anaerovoracaceae bacterium]
MTSKVPNIARRIKVCIICEGSEEYEYIESLTGVCGYKASKAQRELLFSKVTVENYSEMCGNLKILSKDDTVIGSSNFDKLIKNLESEDGKWIKRINGIIQL